VITIHGTVVSTDQEHAVAAVIRKLPFSGQGLANARFGVIRAVQLNVRGYCRTRDGSLSKDALYAVT
jgi:hypothetical protein